MTSFIPIFPISLCSLARCSHSSVRAPCRKAAPPQIPAPGEAQAAPPDNSTWWRLFPGLEQMDSDPCPTICNFFSPCGTCCGYLLRVRDEEQTRRDVATKAGGGTRAGSTSPGSLPLPEQLRGRLKASRSHYRERHGLSERNFRDLPP